MTPKQFVLKKYPKAELVRDGFDSRLSGFYDFAIYNGQRAIAEGPTPQTAWDEARRVIQRRNK